MPDRRGSYERRTTTASAAAEAAFTVSVRQIRVAFASPHPKRSVAVLDAEPCVIGREPEEGGLAIPDREISRRHAAIEREGDTWFVRDLDSRNGVFVDGVRQRRVALDHGAVIRIGKVVLLYQELQLGSAEPLKQESSVLRGPSLAMQRVRAEIALVAPAVLPVLVLGETGVGKELVAQEIHRLSGRRGPLVPVNCAAIPAELAESELFGHAAGAFTGAARASAGLFAAAEGGTLFLDEVGEMPPLVQAKVLRALENGEVRPVGARETTRVDVRIVAATHRDLTAREGGTGDFRADLFARLSGFTVQVPPLRERRDDILPLAQMFLEKGQVSLSADAAEALLLHAFPYNVRELRQLVATAAVRAAAQDNVIRIEHLPVDVGQQVRARATASSTAAGRPLPLEATVARDVVPDRTDFCRAAEQLEGNVARMAAFFRKDRGQIYRWAKRFEVDLEAFRRG